MSAALSEFFENVEEGDTSAVQAPMKYSRPRVEVPLLQAVDLGLVLRERYARAVACEGGYDFDQMRRDRACTFRGELAEEGLFRVIETIERFVRMKVLRDDFLDPSTGSLRR